MYEIAICDGEEYATGEIEKKIQRLALKNSIYCEIDVFFRGLSLVDQINNGKHYDFIYLDIDIPDENGIQIAYQIRKVDRNVLIIFVTSQESFAKEAFEVEAFRFILKPIDNIYFEKCFKDICKKLKKDKIYYNFKYNKSNFRIKFSDILYFQSDKRVTYIITEQASYKCYEKLDIVEKYLNDSQIWFYRIHKSLLINPCHVNVYSYGSIIMFDGSLFSITEKRRKQVNEVFCKLRGEELGV